MLRKLLIGLVAMGVGLGVGPLSAGTALAAPGSFFGLCEVRDSVTGRCQTIGIYEGNAGTNNYVQMNCRDGATPCTSWVIVGDPFGLELKNHNEPFVLTDASGGCVNKLPGYGSSSFPFLIVGLLDGDCDGIDDDHDDSRLAGDISRYQIAGGESGVPADIAGVAMNVTVTGAKSAGFLTVFPCGQPTPKASNLNYDANGVIPNLVIASPGTNGEVCFYNSAALDLIIDIAGFFSANSGYVAQASPERAADTRNTGKIGGPVIKEVAVAGVFGVPADAAGVALNVTIVDPTNDGFATVFPCGPSTPNASNVNFVKGHDIPNFVVAMPGVGGKVCVYASTVVDVIVDVSGYFAAGTGFVPTTSPVRLLDSRSTTRIAAGTAKELSVLGDKGIPADAAAVAMNVTAVGAAADGFMTVYPCGEAVPTASNVNYKKGQDIANTVLGKPGLGGKVCFYSDKAVDIVVDASGYFGAASTFVPITPTRDVDTREARI
jgi:hypothetical protein